MDILSNFSETLSELMSMYSLNAEELSKKITIERSTITRYKEGKTIPSLPYAIELADFFGCSLDYLFSLTNDYEKKSYLPCPPFYRAFKEALKFHNRTKYRLHKDLGIANQTLIAWDYARNIPTIDNLIILANYFGCTLDELVGRKAEE